jgi:thiol-disulfide isomerase/thioredoxin
MASRQLRRRCTAILGVLMVLALSSCSRAASDAGVRVGGPASDSTTVGVTYLPPDQRTSPVALTGTTLTGEPWTSRSLVQKVLVVNVWASWCGPCRAEAPILAALSAKYASRGVQFIGVDTRDSDINGEAFTKTFAIPYPSLSDRSGQLLLALSASLPPSAIPSTLVLDRQGRVAGRIIGPVTGSGLGALIERIAAETPK